MATASVPARTTSAEIVPAPTSAVSSLGFSSPLNTGCPSARTSTAGAAATWRTVSRALPASTFDTSLTKAVSWGVPSADRWAAIVAFAPAGTSIFFSMAGFPSGP